MINDKVSFVAAVCLGLIITSAIYSTGLLSPEKLTGYEEHYLQAKQASAPQIKPNMSYLEKEKVIEYNCKMYVGISDNWIYKCMKDLNTDLKIDGDN